jgi:preprotein translocase subunit SecA
MAQSLEEKYQRGHPFAVVDEVDNILIDEARTPLIISGQPEQAADLYEKFARMAKTMQAGKRPEGMDPRAKKDFVADFDYEFDEKHKTVSVSERGVAKAERFLGIDHLYRADNGHLVNHLQQALKAESLYKRDKDYAVIDDEVKIIDEFTGRILDGRRWSEGLHQAVEAKEGVRVQEENQTLAQITLQNYFRMYDKLSGMTGTALTEATEFMKIYKLPVVQIPTNSRWSAWTRTIRSTRRRTASGRRSPRRSPPPRRPASRSSSARSPSRSPSCLGRRLKERGIKHTVLNAKPEYAEREGEIVAEAGQPGAVTIATNMAGRGVDIKLGGNAEHLTQLELSKLGLKPGDPTTTSASSRSSRPSSARSRRTASGHGGRRPVHRRHRAPRVAPHRQPAARPRRPPGRPGESRFFLSAEDDLVRLFAGDRIYKILDRLGHGRRDGNEEPIEAGMLSKQIEKAQKKVEEQNFLIRKRVLEYDDVMNEQRRIVYAYRDQVLEGTDMGDTAREKLGEVIESLVDEYTPGDFIEEWDLNGLTTAIADLWPSEIDVASMQAEHVDRVELSRLLTEDAIKLYDERERDLGDEIMRQLERFLLLQTIDQRWREHLYDMDYLREGIHLRGFAQIDPLVAYKNEAFDLFTDLMKTIWADFARQIFNVEVVIEGEDPAPPPTPNWGGASSSQTGRVNYSGGAGTPQPSALATAAGAAAVAPEGYVDGEDGVPVAPIVETRHLSDEEQIGRNDPCWCGSGKKFKKCHGT